MKIIKTSINDLFVIEPIVYKDNRGWFFESYNKEYMHKYGINYDFIQDNHSFSINKGTIRGLHLQFYPKAQTKLVRCTRGKIFDVAVDLRADSCTFKKWYGIELSEENKKQLLIPKGFAHGFITLTNNTEVQYKVDEYYSKEHDCSLRWNDKDFGIKWPSVDKITLSYKDENAINFKDLDINKFKTQKTVDNNYK